MLHFAMATTTEYVVNGAVDIGSTVASALVFVQITKGWLFARLDSTKNSYDSLVESYDLLISLLMVYGLYWAILGFHSHLDVLLPAFYTLTAVAAQLGIYGKIRGPVPATPTEAWLAAQESSPQIAHARQQVVARRAAQDLKAASKDEGPPTA